MMVVGYGCLIWIFSKLTDQCHHLAENRQMVCINWLHSVVFRLEAVPFFLTKEPFNCGLVVDKRDYDITVFSRIATLCNDDIAVKDSRFDHTGTSHTQREEILGVAAYWYRQICFN